MKQAMAEKKRQGSLQFLDRLFKQNSLRNFGYNGAICGYEFEVSSNGYRGTYLSCVEDIDFTVDGRPIPRKNIVFIINNKRFLLKHLKELYSEYWFTLDYALIRVYQDGGLPPGHHEVGYHLVTRIPFSGYFGSYHKEDTTVSNTFTLSEDKK
jgi:hypothetical protein